MRRLASLLRAPKGAGRKAGMLRLEHLEPRVLLNGDGLWLTQLLPTGAAATPFDTMQLVFSEPVQDGSLTLGDVALSGPGGPIVPVALNKLAPDRYELVCTGLTGLEAYSLSVGPDVLDGGGAPMDQDHDGSPGEPGQDAYVARLVAEALTIGSGDATYDGLNLVLYGSPATVDGSHPFDSLGLYGGTTLTHSAATESTDSRLELTLTDGLVVDGTSAIDVTAKGYVTNHTVGNTTEGASTGSAGGSYGGLGGSYSAVPNRTYGDYRDPNELGSGGGGWVAGSGGGLVRITAGSATIDGTIVARGGSVGHPYDSAGSGGGIRLDVGTLAGSGGIEAGGGESYWGGSGGGGRVAVYYDDLDGFDLGNVTAFAGHRSGADAGSTGTVFLEQSGGVGELRIDSQGNPTAEWTPLGVSGDAAFEAETLVVSGAGVVVKPEHQMPIEADEVHLLNGAVLTTLDTTETEEFWLGMTVSGELEVDATSAIDVTARGYVTNRTLGNTTEGASTGEAGGSYGGLGGSYSAVPNRTYGDYRDPNELGSGGGGWVASAGGGLVRITAGSASIDGVIRANGGDIGHPYDSAGSGGGIRLDVGTLGGSGTIEANGGTPYWGGGGGGGRVAVYYDTLDGFDLANVTAFAGHYSGQHAGGVGTVYFKPAGGSEELRIDSQGNAAAEWTPLGVGGDAVFEVDALIISGAGVVVRPEHQLPILAGEVHVVEGAKLSTRSTTTVEEYWLEMFVEGELEVDAASSIDVTGLGYVPGRTVGNSSDGAPTGSAGGSYGGLGASYGGQSNATYGDYRNPHELGSGGANSGPGGGLVRITAGSATIEGAIRADGTSVSYPQYAAGAGGGVLLNVGTLAGDGTISADGGQGYWGGSGGGGRVAVYVWGSRSLPVENITATGGIPGAAAGEDGTAYLADTPFATWEGPNDPVLHDTELLRWAGLGMDPATVTVDVTAYGGGGAHAIASGLAPVANFAWDSTSLPDGRYDLRVVFTEAGSPIGEVAMSIAVNNSLEWHTGTVGTDEAWSAALTHAVDGQLAVASGATLTIEPGAVVKLDPWSGFKVEDGGAIDAPATAELPIILTSLADDTAAGDSNLDGGLSLPLPGDWAGFTAEGTGQYTLTDYVDIRYATASHQGTLGGDETWPATWVHVVPEDLTVPDGVTLTIEPGAIVKLGMHDGITVETGGSLIAEGTLAQPITFTSLRDDSMGGDTNSNGTLNGPAAGDWRWIYVAGGEATFDHVSLLYGAGTASGAWDSTGVIRADSNGTVALTNSIIRDAFYVGVIAAGGDVTITNSIIARTDRAVDADAGTTRITNSTIDDNRIGLWGHVGALEVTNTIVSNSLESGLANVLGSPVTIAYSNIWSATGTNYSGSTPDQTGLNGNISADPLYRNAAQDNVRLGFGSPAIDAADGTAAPDADLMGAPRYDDPRSPNTGVPTAGGAYADMGAFEAAESAASDIDLVVNWLNGPAEAEAGQQATLQWQVTNVGTGTAIGPWHDAIALVADVPTRRVFELAAGEALVGSTLGPGESAIFEATVTVPGGTEGTWRWQVQVNSRGDVFEGANWSNNAGPLSASVELTVPSLTKGTPHDGTFAAVGQPVWSKVDQAAGEQLLVTLDGAAAVGRSRIYAGFGSMPTEQAFDLRSSDWNTPDPRLGIPAPTAARTIYLLVVPEAIEGADLTYTATAQIAEFAIEAVDADHAGNAGTATVRIQGSGFGPTLEARLSTGGGATLIDAQSVVILDSTAALATFDLDGAPLGAYDVLAIQDAITRTLPAAFTVSTGTGADIEAHLVLPEFVRTGRDFQAVVEFANTGDADYPVSLIMIESATGNPIWLEGAASTNPDGTLQFLSMPNSGPSGGVVRPGQASTWLFNSTASAGANAYTINYCTPAATEPIDWDEMKLDVPRPESDPVWDQAWDALVASIGTTYGDYIAALTEAADEARGYGRSFLLPTDLLNYMVARQMVQMPGAAVSGTAFLGDTAHALGRSPFSLVDAETGEAYGGFTWYDGSFAVHDAPAGTYELHFEGAQPQPAHTLTVPDGGAVTGLEIVVQEGSQLLGRVFDPSHTPIAGARVRATDVNSRLAYATEADDQGRYLLTGLPAGTFKVEVWSDTYASPTPQYLVLQADQSALLNLTLSAGGSVTGHVFQSGGAPMEGATVHAWLPGETAGKSAVTDADGAFTIVGLGAGSYQMAAVTGGLGTILIAGVDVADGAVTSGVDLTLADPGLLLGSVTDRDTGLPIEGATVGLDTMLAYGQTAVTDADGLFTWADAPAGSYTLWATADGYLQDVIDVTVGGAPAVVSLRPAGIIDGSVELADGTPLEGMAVTLLTDAGPIAETTTSAAGTFSFSDLADGDYAVAIGADTGFTVGRQAFTLDETDNTFTADIQIDAALLSGTVSLPGGGPAEGARVALVSGGDLIATVVADDQGHYEFLVLQDGSVDVVALGAGIGFVRRTVAVTLGSPSTGQDLAATGVALSVAVSSPATGQAAVDGAYVVVSPSEAGWPDPVALTVQTDASGQAELSCLSPGDYHVSVAAAGLAPHHQTITVGPGATNLDVELLDGRSVQGIVRDSGGEAIPFALVSFVDQADGKTYQVTTDEDGAYATDFLPVGTFDVWGTDGVHCAAVVADLSTAAEPSQTLDFALADSGAAIEGQVTDPAGAPVVGQEVVLAVGGAEILATRTDGEGNYELGPLPAGAYDIRVQADGFTLVEASVVLAEGEQATRDVVLGQAIAVVAEGASAAAPLAASAAGLPGTPSGPAAPPAPSQGAAPAAAAAPQPASIYDTKIVRPVAKHTAEDLNRYKKIVPKNPDCKEWKNALARARTSEEWVQKSFDNWMYAYEAIQDLDSANTKILLAQGAVAAGKAAQLMICVRGEFFSGVEMFPQNLMDAGEKLLQALTVIYDSGLNGDVDLLKYHVGILFDVGVQLIDAVSHTPWAGAFGSIVNLIVELKGFVDEIGESDRDTIKGLRLYTQAQAQYESWLWHHGQNEIAVYNASFIEKCGGGDPPRPPGTPDGGSPGGGFTTGLGSLDPNDKATVGFGPNGYVTGDTTLLYTIRFENLETADLPAQHVVVTDALDANLDWTTFELGGMGFNNTPIAIPAGLQDFSTTVTVPTDPNEVQVTVSFDPDTGVVTWDMMSIDPVTGELVEDPLAGFLPPNDVDHSGEGYVTYTVQTLPSLTSGDEITNLASIVFDVNDPIVTNQTLNTIDDEAPTSSVTALPAWQLGTAFTVEWTGQDGLGSGIASYDIFVSDEGGAYTLWLDDTTDASATFTGTDGHTYDFYSVAVDNVGNEEAAPGSPDASTEVRVLALTSSPVTEVAEDAGYTYDAASTADGLAGVSLTYSLEQAPANLAIDPATGIVTGSFDNGEVGDKTVEVKVDDGQGHTDTQLYTLTVTNVPGEFAAPLPADPSTVVIGNAFAFDLASTDEGQGTTAYSIAAGPAWLGIDPATGALSGTPTGRLHIATTPVTIGVDDGNGGTDDLTFDLTVEGQVVTLDPTLRQTKATFTDASGDAVTVAMSGKVGVTHIIRAISPVGGSYSNDTPADVYGIEAVGTDAKTSLKIASKGQTSVGDIVVHGSLKQLAAKTTALLGDLTVDDWLGKTLLADIADQHTITLGGTELDKPITFIAGHMQDVTFASGAPIKAFTALDWLDTDDTPDTLATPSLGSLTTKGRKANAKKGIVGIAGDFEASLDLDGTGNPKYVLGKAKIAGSVTGGTWTIAGTVGSILTNLDFCADLDALSVKSMSVKRNLDGATINLTQAIDPKLMALAKLTVTGWTRDTVIATVGNVAKFQTGGMDSSSLLLGVPGAELPDEAADFAGQTLLKSFTVKGIKDGKLYLDSFIDSDVAAWAITKASIREIATDNAGDAFGFAWCELKSLKWQDGRDKFKWPEKKPTDWPDDTGDFVADELA